MKYLNSHILVLLAIAILTTACASASFVRTSPTAYFPKPKDYFVPIISNAGPQLDPNYYAVIGTVEATKDATTIFGKVSLETIFDMLREKAREGGADALMQVQYRRGRASGRNVDNVWATGVAIVFRNREEALTKLKEMGAVFK